MLLLSLNVHGQNLKVVQSPSDRIYRDTKEGHALVLFDSAIENLTVESSIRDKQWKDKRNGRELIFIEPRVSQDTIFHIPNERRYLLKADNTNEYCLAIENMQPKNVYYYVVTLKEQIPLTVALEYNFAGDRCNGIKASIGRRFGGYLNYQWGKYLPSGNNIDDIKTDTDITKAQCLGYIKTLIVGGVRACVNQKIIPVYVNVGGGYGVYGRQWENPTIFDGSKYFYSDYIKGGAIEAGVTVCIPNLLIEFINPTISIGVDAIMNKSRVSVDYQLGFGLSVNMSYLFR
jgi:hypothetical protein